MKQKIYKRVLLQGCERFTSFPIVLFATSSFFQNLIQQGNRRTGYLCRCGYGKCGGYVAVEMGITEHRTFIDTRLGVDRGSMCFFVQCLRTTL